MNYYEHHLGDYVRDTAHLSMLEDGAYRRLIDAYYIREAPLPLNLREVYRLVRASSKQDREAVETVLREFFQESSEGWRHSRCDREIGHFQEKRSKAKRSADARWSALRSHSSADANASAKPMRTHANGDANGMPHAGAPGPGRPPVPSPQTPDPIPKEQERAATSTTVARSPESDPPEANGQQPTPAGLACRAMRKAGLQQTNPGDPRLLELLRQGATVEELAGVAAEAAAKGKGWPWVLAAVQNRRTEAAAIALAPPAPKPSPTVPSAAADETQRYLAEQRAHQRAAPPAELLQRVGKAVGKVTP